MDSFLIAQSRTGVSRAASQASNNEVVESLLTSLDFLKDLLLSVLVLVAFYAFGKLLSAKIVRWLQEAKGESLDPDIVSLANRFSVYGSLFVGIALVLQFVFDVDFLQIVGFFGLGIGLAFKDLLQNLIAGTVIIVQNRFRVGDFIRIGASKSAILGKVMAIQSRITILKSVDGTEIIIPNSTVVNSPIICYTTHRTRRVRMQFRVDLESNIEKAKHIAIEIMKNKDHVLKKPEPKVLITSIGPSFVVLDMRFWIDPKNNKVKSWVMTKSELIEEIKNAFDREGIVIPYPVYSYLNQKRQVEVRNGQSAPLEGSAGGEQ